MRYISKSEEETTLLGEKVGKLLRAGDGLLFTGEMGSGKTYFTKGLGRALGVTEEITSPTFAIVNEYFGEIPLFHFDLYRVGGYDDLYGIGFFDYLSREGVMVIEWSENVPEISEEFCRTVTVDIEKTGECERAITVKGI